MRHDDKLFPDFRSQDLHARNGGHLQHHAVDGATVDGLQRQLQGVTGPGMRAFARCLGSAARVPAARAGARLMRASPLPTARRVRTS